MKHWQRCALILALVVGSAIGGGYRLGVRHLRQSIVDALGEGSRLQELKVNWFSIEVVGLSIEAPRHWPAARTLEADRITFYPDLRSLLTNRLRIASVVVEKPYLSMFRTPGRLRLLPSLTENLAGGAPGESPLKLRVKTIEIRDGAVDFYDGTVGRTPLKIRIEEIAGKVNGVEIPAAPETQFELAGIVKSIRGNGHATVRGWIGPGARDSDSEFVLKGVDLVALEPYLAKRNEARVARGTLDLDLDSKVRDRQLAGKGRVVLRDLELARSPNLLETFMGVPRNAVIAFLKNHQNAIDVDFTLSGDTDHPDFSLNENLSTRIAAGMAGQLGVSLVSVVENIGAIGQKGIESAGHAVAGIGATIKGLFGGD